MISESLLVVGWVCVGYLISNIDLLRIQKRTETGVSLWARYFVYGFIWMFIVSVLMWLATERSLSGYISGGFVRNNLFPLFLWSTITALILPSAVNYLYNRNFMERIRERLEQSDLTKLRKLNKRNGNELDIMLSEASADGDLLTFNLNGGMVYVGWVINVPNPMRDKTYIRIQPIKSGYRDDQNNIVFTTDYISRPLMDEMGEKSVDEIARFIKDGTLTSGSGNIYRLQKVFPRTEVVSVNIFDLHLYYSVFAKSGPGRTRPSRSSGDDVSEGG